MVLVEKMLWKKKDVDGRIVNRNLICFSWNINNLVCLSGRECDDFCFFLKLVFIEFFFLCKILI